MFDRELLVNSTVDLDMGAVWAAAVNRASDLMRKARENATKCQECVKDVQPHPWCPTRLVSKLNRVEAYAIMAPFRIAISERTEAERAQAWAMVRTGNLRFVDGCTPRTDECGCTRSVWQHIIAYESRTLCPFGREYWVYARAIYLYDGPIRDGDDPFDLRKIARPTAKR